MGYLTLSPSSGGMRLSPWVPESARTGGSRTGLARVAWRPNGRSDPIRHMFTLAALVAAFVVLGANTAEAHHHRHGCHRQACIRSGARSCSRHPACRARVQRKAWRRTARPYWGTFEAIAACESHGNWHISTGNGFYGGIQFTLRSWIGVGGSGNPAAASKLEQIYRGVLLSRIQGFGAWPVCRHNAGV